jgi:hypothetical protein
MYISEKPAATNFRVGIYTLKKKTAGAFEASVPAYHNKRRHITEHNSLEWRTEVGIQYINRCPIY